MKIESIIITNIKEHYSTGHINYDINFLMDIFSNRKCKLIRPKNKSKIENQLINFIEIFINLLIIDKKKNINLIFYNINELFALVIIFFYKLSHKVKVYTYCTNAIQIQRIYKFSLISKYIFKTYYKLNDKVLVLSKYQKLLLSRIINLQKNIVFIISPFIVKLKEEIEEKEKPIQTSFEDINSEKSLNIAFIGKNTKSKPIKPFLQFLLDYYKPGMGIILVGEQDSQVLKIIKDIVKKEDLNYFKRYLNNIEYTNILKETDFIFLSHNIHFSGMLSACLCEAIAFEKFIITTDQDLCYPSYKKYISKEIVLKLKGKKVINAINQIEQKLKNNFKRNIKSLPKYNDLILRSRKVIGN